MAENADGSVIIKVIADTSGAEKAIKALENRMGDSAEIAEDFSSEAEAMGGKFDALSGALGRLGGVVSGAFAVDKLVAFGEKAVSLASDLDEVQNVVDVTFGEGAGTIDAFAKSAASSFGMSELSAKQFTGTMGSMLKSMQLNDSQVMDMSTSLVGLAGDMASFYNLDAETAFEKLRSGISGETEPLKQLGINMSVANLEAFALSQGIETAYSEMTQAEQATLRYNYIMQATADAQGDFARTSDSLANQQRIMQLNMENLTATIGNELLPFVNEFTTSFNDLLSGSITTEDFGKNMVGLATDIVIKLTQALIDGAPLLLDAAVGLLLGLAEGIMDSIPVVIDALPKLIGSLIDSLMQFSPKIIDAGVKLLSSLVDDLPKIIQSVTKAVPEIVLNILSAIAKNIPKVMQSGFELLTALVDDLPQILRVIMEAPKQIMTSILGGLKDRMGEIKEMGKNIVSGVWEGIKAMGTWIKNKVSDFFGGIINTAKDLLGIHSPSRVFAQIGDYLMLGMGEGIEDGSAAAVKAMKKAASTITRTADVAFNLGDNLRITSAVSHIPAIAAGHIVPAMSGASTNSGAFFDQVALSKAISDAVSGALASVGGGENVFHFYLNGRKMAVEVVKEINNMTRETGKPVLVL